MVELSRVLGRFQDWEHRCYVQMWSRARQFYDGPKFIRVTDDEGAAQYIQINEPAPVDPMTGQPGEPKHHIAQMDVDIVVDSVPDTATLEQEIFQDLLQLAQAYVGTPQMVPFSVLLKLSQIPKKREVLKELEGIQAQQAQAAQPAQQLKIAGEAAKVAETQSKTELNKAKANETEIGAVRDALQGHAEALNPHAMVPPLPAPAGPGSPPVQ